MIVDAVGESWTFNIYTCFCVAAVFFVRRYVPETRGKTLEEIERAFRAAAGGAAGGGGGGGGVGGGKEQLGASLIESSESERP